jgi:hypothetical protein
LRPHRPGCTEDCETTRPCVWLAVPRRCIHQRLSNVAKTAYRVQSPPPPCRVAPGETSGSPAS